MATIFSWRQIQLLLNGHRFTGFADEDPAVEFDSVDLAEITTGRDGTLHADDTGVLGGPVTIKLLPGSESVKQCLRWKAERDRGEHTEFEGTFADPTLGFSAALRGGIFMSCPTMTVPGQTFEVVFHFEEIVPDADGANFSPSPAGSQL